VLGKAVAFCTARHEPPGRPMSDSFKSYVDAFSIGTRAGMTEIVKTDKSFIDSSTAYTGKDFEMMDEQGQSLLKSVQASPQAVCAKLAAVLGSATAAAFKEDILQSNHDYRAKRSEYCAGIPKPKNCE
jgi:hypothetical protein